jgi:hypothetical protein
MPMKRTSLFLDEATLHALHRYAEQRGLSAAAVVREAVAEYLVAARPQASLPSIAGSFGSGHADTSEHVDELLWSDPHS